MRHVGVKGRSHHSFPFWGCREEVDLRLWMALNGHQALQLPRDPFTGRPTFISGPRIAAGHREIGSGLNRQRASGIAEAIGPDASREPLSSDGWASSVAGRSSAAACPLIPLDTLGISLDGERNLISQFLRPLTGGAEAKPFADDVRGVVYKLFDLRETGALGKKIVLEFDGQFSADIRMGDANLFETLEKLAVLHEAGAHPTEIIGLAETGDYLIIKQPLAQPHGPDLNADRLMACEAMKALPVRGGLRGEARLFWIAGKAWLLGDLHQGNIMRDADGQPTVIDALIGSIPVVAEKAIAPLGKAAIEAKEMREGFRFRPSDLFDGVNDDDL